MTKREGLLISIYPSIIYLMQIEFIKNKSKSQLEYRFQEFIDECEFSNRLRPATITGYRNTFNTFRNIMSEIESPKQLTKGVITEFFRRLQTRERRIGKEMKVTGIRVSTTRSYCDKLNSFFKWLVKNSYLNINPFDSIEFPEPKYEDRKALEKCEIQKLIASIFLHSSSALILKRDIAMIYVLLMCGIRKGELKSLQISDLDINGKTIKIAGKTSKSKKTRLIPINPVLLIHLEAYLEERKKRKYTSHYLFVSSNHDRELTEHGIKHWVKKLTKHSGVKFHLHQFRHTFACNLAKLNVNAIKIQKLMGHADLRMTMTYLRSMTTEDLRGDIEKLDIDNFI